MHSMFFRIPIIMDKTWHRLTSRLSVLLALVSLTSSFHAFSRRQPFATPATYSYDIQRPGACAFHDTTFSDCYLCGKVTDDLRIYNLCCEKNTVVSNYCNQLLS